MIGFARSSFDQINAWKLARFNAGTRVALVGGSFSLRVCFVLNIIQRKAASVVIFFIILVHFANESLKFVHVFIFQIFK